MSEEDMLVVMGKVTFSTFVPFIAPMELIVKVQSLHSVDLKVNKK
jgi:hypothetical protein